MKYAEYMLYIDHTELDIDTYKTLINDGMGASQTRLHSLLNLFMSLNVPKDYCGDVDEIYSEGLIEIENDHYAQNMLKYAPLIWALPESVSDAVFHVLEQLVTD